MSGSCRRPRVFGLLLLTAVLPLASTLFTNIARGQEPTAATTEFATDKQSLSVKLPTGWTKANTQIAATYFVNEAPEVEEDWDLFLRPSWAAGNPATLTLTSSRKVRTGKFQFVLTGGSPTKKLQFEVFRRAGADGKYELSNAEGEAAAAPAPISLGGDASRASVLARDVAEKTGSVAELVMTEAANWDSTGTSGRRKYVARFDTYPITSCRTIARILRETADALSQTAPEDFAKVDSDMKLKLEEFYKTEDSEFRRRNPLRDDWKPFLEHIRKRLGEKYGEDSLKDQAFAEFLLREVADGMDQLGNVWLDAATDDLHVIQGSSGSSGAVSSSAGSSSASCPRCRRRCRCARLLFGF